MVAEGLGSFFLFTTVIGSGIMGEALAHGNDAVALIGNTAATGAMLFVLITMLGPISGAQMNPAVSLVAATRREIGWGDAAAYVVVQAMAGIAGAIAAHAMFDLPLLQLASKARTGPGQWLSEGIATFGLVLTIWGTAKFRPAAIPASVALYITAAYWFTSSTSFANPAITVARSLTDTFSGIAPGDAPGFIVAQLAGAGLAALAVRALFDHQGDEAHAAALEARACPLSPNMPRCSTACSTSLLPTARCPPTPIARMSRSSRRAMPRMATSPPMRRWCWPRRRGPIRARWPALIAPKLEALPGVTAVEIAGPGSSTCGSTQARGATSCGRSCREGDAYGRSNVGKGERVNVEYVSANPTGPMHMGHCRGAVVGDALASVLEAAGFGVTREYYVNDAGQPGRYARPLGAPAVPRGAGRRTSARSPRGCIRAIIWCRSGRRWRPNLATSYVDAPESEWLQLFKAQDRRGDDRADQARPRPARHPPRPVRVRGRARRRRAGRIAAMATLRGQGAGLRGRARAAQEPRRA